MLSDFGIGLILPAVLLAVMAWRVPKWLRRRMPEGVRPLMILSVFAVVIMLCGCALMFLGLYLVQGAEIGTLHVAGTTALFGYFLRLSVSAAIIWGPILVLSIAGLPATWTEKTW